MGEDKQDVLKDKPKKEIKKELQIGIVTDCLALAIRIDANKDSKQVGVLPVKSEVKINIERSTNDFYHVTVDNGITGYCMKSFIRVR